MPRESRPSTMKLCFRDFFMDEKVDSMTTEELGAYWLLLYHAWERDPPGSIPDDDKILRNWTKLSQHKWQLAKQKVLQCFEKTEENGVKFFVQKRLNLEYEASLEKLHKYQERSAKANEVRWSEESRKKLSVILNGSNKDIQEGIQEGVQDGILTDSLRGPQLELYSLSSSYPSDKKEDIPPNPPSNGKPKTPGKKKSKPEVSEKAIEIAGIWYDRMEAWEDTNCKRVTRAKYIYDSAELWDKALRDEIIKGVNHTRNILDWIEKSSSPVFTWKGKVFSATNLFVGDKAKIFTIVNRYQASINTGPVDDYNPSEQQIKDCLEDIARASEYSEKHERIDVSELENDDNDEF